MFLFYAMGILLMEVGAFIGGDFLCLRTAFNLVLLVD